MQGLGTTGTAGGKTKNGEAGTPPAIAGAMNAGLPPLHPTPHPPDQGGSHPFGSQRAAGVPGTEGSHVLLTLFFAGSAVASAPAFDLQSIPQILTYRVLFTLLHLATTPSEIFRSHLLL